MDNSTLEPIPGLEPVYTVAEVARIFRVAPRTPYSWHHAGQLPAVVLPGGGLRFTRGAVQALLAKGAA